MHAYNVYLIPILCLLIRWLINFPKKTVEEGSLAESLQRAKKRASHIGTDHDLEVKQSFYLVKFILLSICQSSIWNFYENETKLKYVREIVHSLVITCYQETLVEWSHMTGLLVSLGNVRLPDKLPREYFNYSTLVEVCKWIFIVDLFFCYCRFFLVMMFVLVYVYDKV